MERVHRGTDYDGGVAYGVLGGSFDPIHVGHVAAAEAVRELRGLERVYLVPAGRAPHKRGARASFEDRLEMARLAVRGRPGLEVLDLEGRRPGPSYTVDTLEELRRLHPGDSCELLVGADMLADLPRWHRAGDVVEAALVVAFGRPAEAADLAREGFEAAFGAGRHVWVEIDPIAVSSSDLRRWLAAGDPVAGLLDPAVEAYIRAHGLYGTGG